MQTVQPLVMCPPARPHCSTVRKEPVHSCFCQNRVASWQCAQRPATARRGAGAGTHLTSMMTMTEWEEDVREGEAKNHKAHNLKELFRRADLDGYP